ncbi:MAG: RluA family pseudouridine synthase [Lachnospiraceae bacterium]|nr:RluA family pseudouridine synthase [Lachnospiraceae bacterium]
MQEIKIGPNQAGQRLDKFLHKYLPNATSSFLYKMLRKKNITLNGKKAEGKEILAVGDVVQSFFADETFLKFSGGIGGTVDVRATGSGDNTADPYSQYREAYNTLQGISVLYEDEQKVLLNKPAGVLTQKAKDTDLSLNEWLIGYLLATGSVTNEALATFKPSVCNRLDRNTSGIVICGKTLAGSQQLSEMIRTRKISKFYRTICVGKIRENALVEGYLYKDPRTNKVTVTGTPPAGVSNEKSTESSSIKTAYTPLQTNDAYTLLEVELITGKTHQIRAHLACIGHPLIGDFKYGDAKTNRDLKARFGLSYQLLHAYRVCFPDGTEIVAPYPEQFQIIENALI